MAAGLGFKTFTTGEVLTAADTNGYLMQGVLVFASAAARDAAITSPQEGQCCYLKDTDAVLTYSGSAWVGFDDSNAIQNTIVDAKGDLIAATAADTPARLAVGANDTVLTADSTAATGLKWATAASSGLTLINTTSFSAVSNQTINSIFSSTYQNYVIYAQIVCSTTTAVLFQMRTGSTDSNANYQTQRFMASSTTLNGDRNADTSNFNTFYNAVSTINGTVTLFRPFEAASTGGIFEWSATETTNTMILKGAGLHTPATSYDGLRIYPGSGTMTGIIRVYGVKN